MSASITTAHPGVSSPARLASFFSNSTIAHVFAGSSFFAYHSEMCCIAYSRSTLLGLISAISSKNSVSPGTANPPLET